MQKKENQRIALTRCLLQEGLLRLLTTEKLEDISVTALCKEAGINRATFYNHYTSPQALLAEMEADLVFKLQSHFDHSGTLEAVVDQTERCLIILKENAALFQILAAYHTDRDLEHLVERIVKHYDEHRLNLQKTQFDPDVVHLVSSYLYAGCYNLIREWLVRDIDKTPREVAELLVSIVSKDYL